MTEQDRIDITKMVSVKCSCGTEIVAPTKEEVLGVLEAHTHTSPAMSVLFAAILGAVFIVTAYIFHS